MQLDVSKYRTIGEDWYDKIILKYEDNYFPKITHKILPVWGSVTMENFLLALVFPTPFMAKTLMLYLVLGFKPFSIFQDLPITESVVNQLFSPADKI